MPNQLDTPYKSRLSQFIWSLFHIKNRSLLLALYSIILKHTRVYAGILTLKVESWCWSLGIENEAVIAVRAILVTVREVQPIKKLETVFDYPPVFEFLSIFSKAFLAFFTCKGLRSSVRKGKHVEDFGPIYHDKSLEQGMIFLFLVAFCAVKPFAT